MDKNNNYKPFSEFDWRSFEKSFGGHLPNASKDMDDRSTWVEQYVHNILKQSIPALDPYGRAGHYDIEITETHHNILLKINIPDKTQAQQIKIFVAASQVKLEENAKEKIQLIRLPHPVVPTSCQAVYKGGILNLHIRKQSMEEPFYEIDVKYS